MDVVLFDIDGTLIDTGGAGRRAIVRASARLFGRGDLFDGIHFDGATDRAITRVALQRLGKPFGEEEIDALLEAYVTELEAEVAVAEGYRVISGAEPLVRSFQARGILLGLGTGNVEVGARIKLRRAGLNAPFGFGGFGDDGEARADILRAGLRRAEALLGKRPSTPWVIGDTPHDASAARAIGARVVLVATGRFTMDELLPCEADLCVESLADPRVGTLAG